MSEELERIADLAHDDIVDLFFAQNLCSADQAENRRLFDAVDAIIRRRMRQLADGLRPEPTKA